MSTPTSDEQEGGGVDIDNVDTISAFSLIGQFVTTDLGALLTNLITLGLIISTIFKVTSRWTTFLLTNTKHN